MQEGIISTIDIQFNLISVQLIKQQRTKGHL